MTTRSADRVLIANRGEIALRVVRTVRDLGGTSILPYTPEDLLSPAAELADEAHALPEGSSYTDAAAILDLARRTGADAIHPGYGFLAERADFARAVMDAGITWVGPSPEAMEALGDKMSARATAERAGVAPVPGITDSVTGLLVPADDAQALADALGSLAADPALAARLAQQGEREAAERFSVAGYRATMTRIVDELVKR